MPAPRTGKRQIEAAKKRAAALEMRLAGATLQQVADKHTRGDRSNAHRMITEAIAELKTENVAEVREMELQRLDALLLGVWARARRGDEKAAQTVLRIMERRAKLLGLDTPVQIEQMGDGIVNVVFDGKIAPRPMAEAELEIDRPEAGPLAR